MQVAQSGHRHSVHENFRFGYVCMKYRCTNAH